MTRRVVPAVVVAALLAVPAAVPAATQTVTMGPGNTFAQADTQGGINDGWQWMNSSGVAHDATLYDGGRTTGLVDPGATSTMLPFPQAGRFEYFCSIHPATMRAVLSVAPTAATETFARIDARPGFGAQDRAAVTAGTGAVAVSPGLVLDEPSGEDIGSATVSIADGRQSGDTLAGGAAGGITGAYSASSGVLMLTGLASQSAYQAALRSVTFATTSGSGSRRVVFQATDAPTGTGQVGAPDYRFVDVAPGAPPPRRPATTPGTAPSGRRPPATAPGGTIPPGGRLTVRLAGSSLALDRRGRVLVRFQTQPRRRGSVTLEPLATGARAAQGRRGRLAQGSFEASPTGAVRVRLPISRAGRRAIRRAGRRGLAARLFVRVGAQQATGLVRIRAARRP